MRYQIQNTNNKNEIYYEDISESAFLLKYLKNPNLMYWQIRDDGTRDFYRKRKHMTRILPDGTVITMPGIKNN